MGNYRRCFVASPVRLGILVLVLACCRQGHAQDASFVRDVAQRLNAQRVEHQLKPLAYSKTLEKAAQSHAEWMAHKRKMEHLEEAPKSLDEYRTCNEHPANRVVNAGYFNWDDLFLVERTPTGAVVHPKPGANQWVGEIIAKGANAGHPATQPQSIVPGWMNSPGHRVTILTPQFQEFGVGTACIGNDTYRPVGFGPHLPAGARGLFPSPSCSESQPCGS